ncbi:33118_t:CDS:2, partial [Racocetra persica]
QSTSEISSFTISKLSEYYNFYCNKLLQNIDKTKQNKEKNIKKNGYKKQKTGHSTLKEASQNRGKEFEKKVVVQLKNVDDYNKASYSLEILQNAQIGRFLYQLKFEVPDDLYDKLGIKNYKLRPFIPDFIEVIEEDGEKRLMIWDAKATKETRISHQFQVTTYAYILDHIIKNHMCEISISRTGGIFLPSADGLKLHTFSIDLILPRVKRFLCNELPQIISTPEVSWHYNSHCKTCEFVNVCRDEAKRTVAMIAYSSIEEGLYLKQILRNERRGDRLYKHEPDIEELASYIKNGPNDNKVKQIIKYDKYNKKSPYLESKSGAQFIHIPTATFPRRTDHNLVIAMSLDNFVSRPFSWSICLYASNGNIINQFKYAKSNSKSENETLSSFISLMSEFITCLERTFNFLSKNNSRACIFVYSEKEKIAIQDSLLKLITLDPNQISESDQHKAILCLFNIFEDCSLLLATENDYYKSSELADEFREFPRLIVLEQSLKENIAINVPGFYRVTDVWEQMVKPTLKYYQKPNDLEYYIDNIDLEDIYATWVSATENEVINKILFMRSKFVNSVIHAYYALLNKSTNDIESILLFSPQAFVVSNVQAIQDFKHHYLRKLYFFKQFEAFTSSSQQKRDRLKDLAQEEATCRIKFDKIISDPNKSKELTAQFNVCNEDSFTFKKTILKEFILVEDTLQGTLKAIRFSDIKYKNKSYDCQLPIFSLDDVDNCSTGITIQLKGKFTDLELKKDATYRLYKRYLDLNTNKILEMLKKIDKKENSLFLNILKDPNTWGSPSSEKYTYSKELKDTALKLCDKFSMSPSQKDIATELLEKRLQIVWGPPGSGKTHFLALFVTWYLTAVIPRTEKKNCIIGITAYTKSAIDNLLERISQLRKETSDFSMLRITNDKKSLKKSLGGIKDCRPKQLKNKIKGDKPIVIGSTVWNWYKVHNECRCDIMIIDEGSQLLTSDACVVLEILDPDHGKLIIAGDHMQLGPIIKNTYPTFPDDHPFIFGSIQQCLMRKENGTSFNEGNFFLEKGQKHEYGPCTLQLKDNWRMNEELNSFFQEIYGDNYISKNPTLKLNLDYNKLLDPDIRKILFPGTAITLVKLILNNHEKSGLLAEADIVSKIVSGYFDANQQLNNDNDKPSLFIVTPQHSQRLAIHSKVKTYLENPNFNLKIDTVEKMQGQQADLVIACFGFHNINEIARKCNFLFDPYRWNVAISRARCVY